MRVIQVLDAFYPAEVYGGVLVAEKIIERVNYTYPTSVISTDLKTLTPLMRLLEFPAHYFGASIKRARAYRFPKLLPIIAPRVLQLLFSEIGRNKKEEVIIHSHTYLSLSSFFSAIVRAVCPRVRFVHQPHYHPFPGGKKRGYWVRRLYDWTIGKYILHSADRIVVMSESEKSDLSKIFKNDSKIVIIPHGVRNFILDSKHKRFRRNYGLGEKDFIILCVSRVGNELLDFFIELMKNIKDGVKSLIVGGVWGKDISEEGLKRKIKVSGLEKRIIITGYLSEETLAHAYFCSDVFIKPTHYEAFGIAFLEAMSAGLPILSYRVGALPELIEEGVNGFLFEEGEIKKIAKKVNELSNNPGLIEKIARNNREKAKRYLWDNILDRYIEIYKELARQIS